MLVALTVGFPEISIGGSMAPVNQTEQSPALRGLLQRLQRHYQATSSFSANFTEEIIRVGGINQKRDGTVDYKRPGLIRWRFTGSQPETIVSNGKTIYDYDPGLDQVVESPLKEAFKTSPLAAFMLGVGNIERDFNASEAASSGGLRQVILKPKGGGNQINLGINPSTLNIENLTVKDALGNTTLLHFSDIRINAPLSPALFKFKVPRGADIVGVPDSSPS
ncbi:MAG: outer membrane lipoprotein chaperone LolA [Candidatus Binataceae bacterium]